MTLCLHSLSEKDETFRIYLLVYNKYSLKVTLLYVQWFGCGVHEYKNNVFSKLLLGMAMSINYQQMSGIYPNYLCNMIPLDVRAYILPKYSAN